MPSALRQAAGRGDADAVEKLLAAGAEVGQVDPQMGGQFPLLVAAGRGHAKCVRLLLEAGAEAEQELVLRNGSGSVSTLIGTVLGGHAHCAQLLLDAGADAGRCCPIAGGQDLSPLFCAAEKGHAACVRLLLDRGAQVDGMSGAALFVATFNGHAECVQLLLNAGAEVGRVDHRSRQFPLYVAVGEGHSECTKVLLQARADANQTRRWAEQDEEECSLLHAAHLGHTGCVDLLLRHGANADWADSTTSVFPLFMATQEGHADCVKALLHGGAKVDRVLSPEGWWPLLVASENGDADIVEILLASGAAVNRTNPESGEFPLFLAAKFGKPECVKLLLEGGAEVDQVSARFGDFPLLQAAHRGHASCVKEMLTAGADASGVWRHRLAPVSPDEENVAAVDPSAAQARDRVALVEAQLTVLVPSKVALQVMLPNPSPSPVDPAGTACARPRLLQFLNAGGNVVLERIVSFGNGPDATAADAQQPDDCLTWWQCLEAVDVRKIFQSPETANLHANSLRTRLFLVFDDGRALGWGDEELEDSTGFRWTEERTFGQREEAGGERSAKRLKRS